MRGWLGAGMLAAALGLVWPRVSRAYEFEVKATTVGQGRSVRALGLGRNGSALSRRRISQSLRLNLWNLNEGAGDPFKSKSRWGTRATGPLRVYFSSYLRLDREQGDFGAGQLLLDGRFRDAVDVIPELEQGALQLDLLYGYVGVEGLFGGALDVLAGRQLEVQTLDWFSMDGIKLVIHSQLPLSAEVFGGLRVREKSWAGNGTFEPDGSSGAGCEEFVEGPAVGSGSWRPIDGLPKASRSPFTSDDERCPQRLQRMPTVGAAIATEGLLSFSARLSYRRSQSQSPGLLGAPDRLGGQDRGYYPNPGGEVGSGVNEERIALTMRGVWRGESGVRLRPYAGVRYSLLHGLLDEAHVGIRAQRGSQGLESEFFYSAPTFDGDSIFNIFSSEPYSDARMTWRYEPRSEPWSAYLRAWGRRYHSEDAAQADLSTGAFSSASRFAGGGQGGLSFRRRELQMRVDSFAEGGYGGVRIGSVWAGRWVLNREVSLRTRLSVIHFADDSRRTLRGTNLGAQVGARYLLIEGVAADLLLEQNSNAFERFAVAAYAMLDLAFIPEL